MRAKNFEQSHWYNDHCEKLITDDLNFPPIPIMRLAVNTVTLRAHTPAEIVSILTENGVDAVEWAGDVHVPPGDTGTAAEVKVLCEAAGIACPSYGAYYQCDGGGQGDGPFRFNLGPEAALDSARALGAPDIRVWAGRKGSAVADAAYREEVARHLGEFCDRTASLGMSVHLEFHPNTLTDSLASTLALVHAVAKDNLFTYWQPRVTADIQENLSDLQELKPFISNVHVYHWLLEKDGVTKNRRPLEEGREAWQAYLGELNDLPGEHYAMIEFVRGDTLSQFAEDVKVLRSIIEVAGQQAPGSPD